MSYLDFKIKLIKITKMSIIVSFMFVFQNQTVEWYKLLDQCFRNIFFYVVLFLGNIWAQTWGNVEKFTRPYPDKTDIDVTAALIAQVSAYKKPQNNESVGRYK